MPAAVARARASIHIPTRVRRAKEWPAAAARGSIPIPIPRSTRLTTATEWPAAAARASIHIPIPRSTRLTTATEWPAAAVRASIPRFTRVTRATEWLDGASVPRSNRIPPQHFDLRPHDIDSGSCSKSKVQMLGCRHGRVLLSGRAELIVIAPITGEECHLSIPPEFKSGRYITGAVLCAAVDHDHVHGSCHSSPFKVVLLSTSTYFDGPQSAFACVYSSETGIWSDLISMPAPYQLHGTDSRGSLIGNSLYWMCSQGDYIVAFDLDGQSLAFIRAPPRINDVRHNYDNHEIIQVVDGVVGLAILSHYYHNIQMWQREVNCQGVTKWVLWKTIDMHNIHGIPHGNEGERPDLIFRVRYAEDTDDIFLYVGHSVYMVQLKSMQSRKLCETGYFYGHHSFKSFYMPGAAIACGHDAAEMLLET